MSVSKQVLAKNAETKLNDFENSVNPCNAAIKFARATGIFTGETDELSVSNVYETAACEWQEFNRPEATDATVHTLLAATAAGSVDFALSGITGDTFTLYYVKVDTASDPGDNNASGAVSITPKTDKQSVVRPRCTPTPPP